jgi:hypothetical protein
VSTGRENWLVRIARPVEIQVVRFGFAARTMVAAAFERLQHSRPGYMSAVQIGSLGWSCLFRKRNRFTCK